MKELIKFSASWCGPCKMLSTIMEGVDFGVPVKEIDIDENMDLAKQYGVRGVPTLVLTEDGKEVKRTSGVMTEEKLKQWLEA
jgi:thioredoxin 1